MKRKAIYQRPVAYIISVQQQDLLAGSQHVEGPSAKFMSDPDVEDDE